VTLEKQPGKADPEMSYSVLTFNRAYSLTHSLEKNYPSLGKDLEMTWSFAGL